MLHDQLDSTAIERFLRRNVGLHLYEIGDLDPFFAPHVRWYGWTEGEQLRAVSLLYTASSPPTLLSFSDEYPSGTRAMLSALRPRLPRHFYGHISADLLPVLDAWSVVHRADMAKMVLRDAQRLTGFDAAGVHELGRRDADELLAFYRESYPHNWFDPRMLETGCYCGVRRDGRLISVAGIHVYSPRYRVSALGNVATLPGYRRQGFARKAVAYLCRRLLETVDVIGLNVQASNTAAMCCYANLGFVACASYVEAELRC